MAHNNMLFYLVLLVLSTDFCLGQTLSTCNKVYVWEFADPLGERSVITRELTNEVEEILTQKNCLILQRRNYERLGRHAGNEKGVKGVEGLSTELTHERV